MMRMGSERVIDAVDILKNSKLQFIKRGIGSAVGLLGLEVLEKAFHNSVVIRMALCRKGLNYAGQVEMLAEFT